MFRETACWHEALKYAIDQQVLQQKCDAAAKEITLYCSDDNLIWRKVPIPTNITYFINSRCPVDPHDHQDLLAYDFGIYADAIKARILMTRQFAHKFFHSFWWGLRNLRYLHFIFYNSIHRLAVWL